MKKILSSIVALLLVTPLAFAQKDLKCYPVFKGKIVPARQMVLTEVRGESMSTYKLDYYRSVQFKVDEKKALEVASLVKEDSDAAPSAQTEEKGDLLTYALIELSPIDKFRRYLCYQARQDGPFWVVTILYLEGSATLTDLRSMFEKQ